ncbi:MAG: hypothetical protein PUC65_14655 [Clostridiales bacterium]|nr:hypothetical protein [Clostridiales bacterium]
MNLEQQLQKIVEEYTFSDGITSVDSMFVNGCIGLYKKHSEPMVFQKIMEYVKDRLSAKVCDLIKIGSSLRFLFEETKEVCYQEAIEKIMAYVAKANRKDGILVHEDGTMYTAIEAYELMPLYAWYETNFNKKEHYIDIMNQLRYWNDQMLIKNTIELYDRCTFMMALADTATSMSEEIYEYYTQIKTWLKDAVHKKLHVVNSDCLRVAYSVLKGCESKALLPEKYEQTGKKMFAKAADRLLTAPVEDKEELGILLMTYALI